MKRGYLACGCCPEEPCSLAELLFRFGQAYSRPANPHEFAVHQFSPASFIPAGLLYVTALLPQQTRLQPMATHLLQIC